MPDSTTVWLCPALSGLAVVVPCATPPMSKNTSKNESTLKLPSLSTSAAILNASPTRGCAGENEMPPITRLGRASTTATVTVAVSVCES